MAHILIIDDEPHICAILGKLLSRDGHKVDIASNGLLGCKQGKLFSYDLVITDMLMPERDGFEVIAEFSKKSPPPHIIVITGGSARVNSDFLITMAKLMPVSRVISKPINYEKLSFIVSQLLNK